MSGRARDHAVGGDAVAGDPAPEFSTPASTGPKSVELRRRDGTIVPLLADAERR
jgi:hypothetical protein